MQVPACVLARLASGDRNVAPGARFDDIWWFVRPSWSPDGSSAGWRGAVRGAVQPARDPTRRRPGTARNRPMCDTPPVP